MSAPTAPSPFMRLPAEIKLTIIELVVTLRSRDGDVVKLNLSVVREKRVDLFSIGAVNQELRSLGGTLSLELHVMSLYAVHPRWLVSVWAAGWSTNLRSAYTFEYDLDPNDAIYPGHTALSLPPPTARPHIKRLELVIPGPLCCGAVRDGTADTRSIAPHWLEPIRQLQALGFGNLESLGVEVGYVDWFNYGLVDVNRFKEALTQKVEQLQPPTKKLEVTFDPRRH